MGRFQAILFLCFVSSFYFLLVCFCRRCQLEFRTAAQSPAQWPRTRNWATFLRQACREPMSSTSKMGKREQNRWWWIDTDGGWGRERKSDQIFKCHNGATKKKKKTQLYLYSVCAMSLKVELFLGLELCVQTETKNNSFSRGHFPPTSQLQYCENADMLIKAGKVWRHLSNVRSAAVVLHTAEIVSGLYQLFVGLFAQWKLIVFFYNGSISVSEVGKRGNLKNLNTGPYSSTIWCQV